MGKLYYSMADNFLTQINGKKNPEWLTPFPPQKIHPLKSINQNHITHF